MSRAEELNALLDGLRENSSEVQACAVVSDDGLVMAGSLPEEVGEAVLAAMSAAMLTMGERITGGLGRGDFEQMFVKGRDGYFLGMRAGKGAVLVATAGRDARLGLVFFDMQRAAEAAAGILS